MGGAQIHRGAGGRATCGEGGVVSRPVSIDANVEAVANFHHSENKSLNKYCFIMKDMSATKM